jgi:hypothetical protein
MAYRDEEKLYLAKLCYELLPIGHEAWVELQGRYNEKFLDQARTKKSLQSQFNKLQKMKPPTGTPTVPKAVQLAKDALQAIYDRAQTSARTSNEEFELVANAEAQNLEPGSEKAMVAVKMEPGNSRKFCEKEYIEETG